MLVGWRVSVMDRAAVLFNFGSRCVSGSHRATVAASRPTEELLDEYDRRSA